METKYQSLTDYDQKIITLSEEVVKLSREYEKERRAFGDAKSNINALLAQKILSFANTKKNIGIEMGYEMLMATSDTLIAEELYKAMIKHENNYRALEVLIDGLKTQISGMQSIMKYNLEGERR